MSIPADQVFAKHMTSKQIEKSDRRAEQLVREYRTLQALRKERELTQVEVAEILGMKQHNISQLEQRPDVLVSTLRKYIEGMGGELDLVVRFPDSDPVKLDGLKGGQ